MKKDQVLRQVDEFIAAQRQKGCREETLNQYRQILLSLCRTMEEGEPLSAETGRRWRQELDGSGLAPRTVNVRISVWNRFVGFLGHAEWQMSDFHRDLGEEHPQLTREEYLQLLLTAREQGKEQTYLLIKTVGGAGLRMRELPRLTVAAVQEGSVNTNRGLPPRVQQVTLPSGLKQELLNFIDRGKIAEGPVFLAQDGSPLSRVAAHRNIRSIGRSARIPDHKANLRCLSQLYDNTQANIRDNADLLFQQAYDQIMEREQLAVGWDAR